MTIKNRTILLSALAALFLIVAPYLVLYSLGYRIDFENIKIVATGGIYVRAQPSGASVAIDGKTIDTTSIFSSSLFVQNLLPKEYNISIKKDGYYDYQKNLLVTENEVTKLENVILFNKNIIFDVLADKTLFSLLKQKPLERFVIRNNNLYYSNAEENSQLTPLQKNTPILTNILAFKVSGNNITWLGLDGFLKSSDLEGKSTQPLSETALKIDVKKLYRLEVFSQNIFLKEGNNLLLFDQKTKLFESFYSPVKDIKLSPDGQKIVYFNDGEIFVYYLNNMPVGEQKNALLQKTSDKIGDIYWLNNDYVIFSAGNTISIFEIDSRGNINVISLPETLFVDNEELKIVKPEMFFDQPNRKLYILAQGTLISSDKILP